MGEEEFIFDKCWSGEFWRDRWVGGVVGVRKILLGARRVVVKYWHHE
jgi:hypothetical protein